jgi:PAS domain S-box-containing protein
MLDKKLLFGQSKFSAQAVAVLLILAVAGALGNHFTLGLLPGIEILFGSIAVLMVIHAFGPVWGVAAAIVSVLPIISTWHHPFGLVLYVGEALVVGLAYRRSGRDVALLDGYFWFFIGMPATWFLSFYFGAHGNTNTAVYFMLRNGANGVANALVASLILQLPALLGQSRGDEKKTSLRRVMFSLLVSSAVVPALFLTVANIRQQQSMVETMVMRELENTSTHLLREWASRPGQLEGAPVSLGQSEIANELRLHDRDWDTQVTLLDRSGRVVATSRDDLVSGQAYVRDRNINLRAMLALGGGSRLYRDGAVGAMYWNALYYELETPLPGSGGRTLLVEIRTEPYRIMLRQFLAGSFLLMLGIVALAFLLGRMFSGRLANPLIQLAEASTNLKLKVIEGEKVLLPISPISEIDVLVENFRGMANGLGKSFREISRSHEDLECRVGERTQALSETNRRLEVEIAERKRFENTLEERALTLEKTLLELETQKFALDQHSIVAITDRAGKIIYANDKFCEMSQYSREELLGQDHRIINSGYHPKSFFAELWTTIARGEVWHGEVRNKKKDGSFYWMETTVVPFLDAERKPYQYVVIRTDITASKQSGEALVRLNRTLKMLNSCDEALVRIRNEDDLLHEICRICVETGGYRMAWVGFAMEDAVKSVRPAAMAGDGQDYLDKAAISWDADAERSVDPVGTAIRSGRYCLIQDISSDPAMQPWCDAAQAHGFAAVIALPLFLDDGQVAVLTVYSVVSNGFGSDEVNLLRDLAANLAYGIKTLRLASDNRRAVEGLRESEDRMSKAFNASPDVIAISSLAEGRFISVNEAFVRVSGYLREEAIGRTAVEMGIWFDPEKHAEIIGRLQRQDRLRDFETLFRTKSGELRVVLLSAEIIELNGERCMLAINHDITNRKRAEQELLRAKEEAEQASRAKSEFLSRMSHELRTPLNAILGFAQLMEGDPVEPLSPSQSESIKHIIQAGWHQLMLVNEVLDLARIEAGQMQMHLQSVMLGQAIRECLDLVSPLSSERRIRVENHVSACGECFVWADPTRFKQVMLNLLSNAIKYNREGGAITLACQRSAPGRQKVSVADTGSGIPADRLEELFIPFNRLDADKSQTQGTGVGLAVAKRLVELMGGEIGVESQLGEGTVFWVELPEHGSDDAAAGIASLAASDEALLKGITE